MAHVLDTALVPAAVDQLMNIYDLGAELHSGQGRDGLGNGCEVHMPPLVGRVGSGLNIIFELADRQEMGPCSIASWILLTVGPGEARGIDLNPDEKVARSSERARQGRTERRATS